MGGHARRGHDHAEALLPGAPGEVPGLVRGPMGREDVGLEGHVEGLEGVHSLLRNGQIAVAAHDDGNFFHVGFLPKKEMMGILNPAGSTMPRRSATYGAPCSSAVLRILPSVARGGVEKHMYLYHIPPPRVKEQE